MSSLLSPLTRLVRLAQVLRETGLRAPALRSVQAGIAVAETLREVAAELAQYQVR